MCHDVFHDIGSLAQATFPGCCRQDKSARFTACSYQLVEVSTQRCDSKLSLFHVDQLGVVRWLASAMQLFCRDRWETGSRLTVIAWPSRTHRPALSKLGMTMWHSVPYRVLRSGTVYYGSQYRFWIHSRAPSCDTYYLRSKEWRQRASPAPDNPSSETVQVTCGLLVKLPGHLFD